MRAGRIYYRTFSNYNLCLLQVFMFRDYLHGDTDVTHSVAYREVPLLKAVLGLKVVITAQKMLFFGENGAIFSVCATFLKTFAAFCRGAFILMEGRGEKCGSYWAIVAEFLHGNSFFEAVVQYFRQKGENPNQHDFLQKSGLHLAGTVYKMGTADLNGKSKLRKYIRRNKEVIT